MAAESLNEEIEYVKLYRIRPVLLHFYLAPFIPIYMIWLYFWTVVYGVTDYFEAGLIALAVVGLLQILSCLFCHWSVHVRCFFTCSTVRIPVDDWIQSMLHVLVERLDFEIVCVVNFLALIFLYVSLHFVDIHYFNTFLCFTSVVDILGSLINWWLIFININIKPYVS